MNTFKFTTEQVIIRSYEIEAETLKEAIELLNKDLMKESFDRENEPNNCIIMMERMSRRKRIDYD